MLVGKYKRGEKPPADSRLGKVDYLRERYMNDRNLDIVQKLDAFAKQHGKTLLELAFSWLAARTALPTCAAARF